MVFLGFFKIGYVIIILIKYLLYCIHTQDPGSIEPGEHRDAPHIGVVQVYIPYTSHSIAYYSVGHGTRIQGVYK